MQEEELLRHQSQINRSQYEINAADTNDNKSVAVKYLGYDPNLRFAKLQDANGNIFYGKTDTNGAIARGEDVRLRRGYGIPGYDAMPHVAPEPAPETEKITTTTKADILYYLEVEKDETTTTYFTEEFTFYSGRCRPYPISTGGEHIYATLEECKLNNSIIVSLPPHSPVSGGSAWTYAIEHDYTGVNFNFNNPSGNLIYYVVLPFQISTYSSYESTLKVTSNVSASGATRLEGLVVKNRAGATPFDFRPRFINEGAYYAYKNPPDHPNFNFVETVTLPLVDDNKFWLTEIFLLLSFFTFADQPIPDVSASGRIEIEWNPPPEPVLTGDFYLRRQQNSIVKSDDISLGEISLISVGDCYIAQTPKKTLISILGLRTKVENENTYYYRFLKRFIIEQTQVSSMTLYENPEIPTEEDDWLQSTYSYNSPVETLANAGNRIRNALGTLGKCFLNLPLYIQHFNFYKSILYELNLLERQNNLEVREILRTSEAIVLLKFSQTSLDLDGDTCSFSKHYARILKLQPIGDSKARIVAISVIIIKKKNAGN